MSKRDSLDTAWRKSLSPVERALFRIPDYWVLKAALDKLNERNFPLAPGVEAVLSFGFPVAYELAALGLSVNPGDYAPDPSLVQTKKPFTWSNAQGDPLNRGAVGTSYHPDFNAEVGSEYKDASGEYELLLLMAGESDMAKATDDPRLFGQGHFVPFWFRVA